MKINFILPFAGNKPIGGFKIVYEYANRLAKRNHTVNVIHPSLTFKDTALKNLGYRIRYYQRKLDKSYNPSKWFKLFPEVNSLFVKSIENKNIPDGDVLIATAWRTAVCSEKLSSKKGKKFYFIQHYEVWNGPEEEVIATWKMPFRKIVIAKWLKEIAESMNEKAEYIPNAFDMDEFQCIVPPEKRAGNKIMMLYNELEFKGSRFGLEAFNILKCDIPELEVTLFGVPERPGTIPEWIKYYRTPERGLLKILYNESSIFLSPSLSEGFPLPPAEAMMCGAAIACSDIGGHREYAIEDETALLFKPSDTGAIVNTLNKLIKDDTLRTRIAINGNQFIKNFTWDRSVDKFEKTLAGNE